MSLPFASSIQELQGCGFSEECILCVTVYCMRLTAILLQRSELRAKRTREAEEEKRRRLEEKEKAAGEL